MNNHSLFTTALFFLLSVCSAPAQSTYSADTARVHALLEASISAEGDTVFAILDEARELARQAHYTEGEAKAWMYTGIEKEEIDDYPGAVKQYLSALDLYAVLRDSLGIAKCYGNLGAAFHRQSDIPKAIAYWERARPLIGRYGQPAHLVMVLSNLVSAYSNNGMEKRALALSDTAYDLAARLSDTIVMANIMNNRGYIYENLRQWDDALQNYKKCALFYGAIGDAENYCRSNSNYAEILTKTGRFQEAWDALCADSAVCLQSNPTLKARVLVALSNAAGGLGYYKEALQYLFEGKAIEDSVYTVQRSEGIREIEEKYQNELLKKEKTLQETQLNNQRNALWAVIGGLLLLALLAWSVWRGKRRSDGLLANILPLDTIRELKRRGSVQARRYESVSVLFSDFKDFTKTAEQMPPEELVAEIDRCFRAFDAITARYPAEKIKTIGDAYMCAAGLPAPHPQHARTLVDIALDMQGFMQQYNAERRAAGRPEFPMRIGIHSGPVVAGVVGTRKFTYDIWGDTVNTAARMESAGEPGRVNISGVTFALVRDLFDCSARGAVEAKNKEPMEMYFVVGRKEGV